MKTTTLIVVILLFILQLNAQTVTTYSAVNVQQTTATIKGHVDPGAGTFYGVEFEVADNSAFTGSTTHGPDEGSNFSSASNVSYNLTGLTQNKTYFFRVKVGYSTVTGGGLVATSKNFTTLSASVPTVNIGSDFTSISDQSASNTSNQVTNDGGSNVSECGLVVATHTTPSTADTKIAITSGLATYSGSITGLTQLTKYYVRAYATNSTGSGYSSVTKSFSTIATTNASIDSMVSHASGELTIYYQTGSGDACIIYMKDGSSITDDPINGTTYTGNTVFGSGSDIGNGTYVVLATTNAKSNSVTVTNLNDANTYYVKTGSYDNSGKVYDATGSAQNTKDNSNLPIELISFSGENTKAGISLRWSTATEFNNNFFTIERSYDNSSFEAINKINGAGNSNTVLTYEYLDKSAENYINYYYRLKQTDYDGNYTYSKTILVYCKLDKLSLLNYDISSNNITLNISNPNTESTVQILSIDGRTYYSKKISIAQNIQLKIDKNILSHGIYLIRIINKTSSITKKIAI